MLKIASDCESLDQGQSHSMSFISDANVLALHRLLWNHQVNKAFFLDCDEHEGCVHVHHVVLYFFTIGTHWRVSFLFS